MVQMNFIFILPIKMAVSHQVLSLGVIQSTWLQLKRQNEKNIIELQYCTGMSQREIQQKNLFYFFFNFQKMGSGGSVKIKIKHLSFLR